MKIHKLEVHSIFDFMIVIFYTAASWAISPALEGLTSLYTTLVRYIWTRGLDVTLFNVLCLTMGVVGLPPLYMVCENVDDWGKTSNDSMSFRCWRKRELLFPVDIVLRLISSKWDRAEPGLRVVAACCCCCMNLWPRSRLWWRSAAYESRPGPPGLNRVLKIFFFCGTLALPIKKTGFQTEGLS